MLMITKGWDQPKQARAGNLLHKRQLRHCPSDGSLPAECHPASGPHTLRHHPQPCLPQPVVPPTSHPTARGPTPSPVIDDLSLTAAMVVVVQDDVAVTTVELPIRGGIHRHFVGAFDSPDLPEQSWSQHGGAPPPPESGRLGTLPVALPRDKRFIGDSTWAQPDVKQVT